MVTNFKKATHIGLSALMLTFIVFNIVQADDFKKLDEAVPSSLVKQIAPVIDFDGDGCLPSAGISRSGKKNSGMKIGGSEGGECRDPHFLNTSNTLHRFACVSKEGSKYCGHFYALYFEKDQNNWWVIYKDGHRHDWEWVAVWTKNGEITHGSVSTHGKMKTRPASDIVFENGHMKIVYHLESQSTHCMRFAGKTLDAKAENPYGKFVTPTITSWNNITGDGIDNKTMRSKLNSFDYGNASIPCKDGNFFTKLNKFKPPGYPAFNKEEAVVIYQHANYKGARKAFQPGKYTMQELGIGNDQLSSLRVPAGLMATLYRNHLFTGDRRIVLLDTNFIGQDFNDHTSSMEIEQCAVIFQHAEYRGSFQNLAPGKYNMKDLSFGHDTLSSVRVPEGWKVTLYMHHNFQGPKKTLTQDTKYVGDTFNDQASSVVVERN